MVDLLQPGRLGGGEIEQVEDVPPARDGGAGQAAGDDLGERGHVRPDAERRLRAAARHAKAGHHLVEDQQHAVPRGQLAQPVQEFGPQRHLAERASRSAPG